MLYKGTVIEESLGDKSILKDLVILSTHIEVVTDEHRTPWLKQWTLHKIQVPAEQAGEMAERIQQAIDVTQPGSWYVDFKNEVDHFIIYKDKIFKVRRNDADGYAAAKSHGIGLGIPEHQVDFSPDTK